MAQTSFETRFLIGARFTGQGEINKANRAIDSVERNLKGMGGAMHRSFAGITAAAHKMRGALKGAVIGAGAATGAAALGVATAAAYGLAKGLHTSIDAALAVEATHEKLGLSLERTAKKWGLSQKQVGLQKQAMIAMGDSMAELGVDGETVVSMLGAVSSAVDPRSLGQYKKGLTDLLVTNKGFGASEEDAAAFGADMAKLIEFKMPKALKNLKGVTEAQVKAYSKLETREQRQIWFFKNIAKETGATEAASKTASGRVITFWNKLEDAGEKIGEPFAKMRGQLAETALVILEKLQPQIDKFASGLGERLAQANKYWNEHQAQIVEAVGKIGNVILWVIDHWKALSIALAATAGIAALITILGTLALAFTALLSPIGLVIAAIATLGIGIAASIVYWNDLKAAAVGAWEAISKAAQTAAPDTIPGAVESYRYQKDDGTGVYRPGGAPIPRPNDSSAKPNGSVGSTSSSAKASGVDPNLLAKLDAIQQQHGKLPINSGYRSPSRNAAVGGARHSQHMQGNAVDVDVSGKSHAERVAIIDKASASGIKGIGVYNNALHFDTAGRRAWGPSHHRGSVPSWAEGAIQRHERGGGKSASLDSTRRGLDKRASATTSNTVTMNAPITVNGASAGQEKAVAREIARSLRDPVEELISRLGQVRSLQDRAATSEA